MDIAPDSFLHVIAPAGLGQEVQQRRSQNQAQQHAQRQPARHPHCSRSFCFLLLRTRLDGMICGNPSTSLTDASNAIIARLTLKNKARCSLVNSTFSGPSDAAVDEPRTPRHLRVKDAPTVNQHRRPQERA